MWKVSCSPAPSSPLFMLPFVDILDVVGVNWKRKVVDMHFDLSGMWVWLKAQNGGEAGGSGEEIR